MAFAWSRSIIIMARWKCATEPATASRRWNVSRRQQWRKLSTSAEVVDPGCGARCAIRDTGAAGPDRYHWTVTAFYEPDPVVAGRGELGQARSQAEMALRGSGSGP